MTNQTMINAEAMRQEILRRRTTARRFRLPMAEETAYALLRVAYMAEVELRGRQYESDAETDGNIRWMAEELTRPLPKKGLLLSGTCGNGKTTLVNALRSLSGYMKEHYLWEQAPSMYMATARDITKEAVKTPTAFEATKNREVLIVDDMGEEAAEVLEYGNVLNPMTELLEHRYAKQLFTIVTTNIPLKKLESRYGKRLYDRMTEMFAVRAFTKESYRKQNTEKK